MVTGRSAESTHYYPEKVNRPQGEALTGSTPDKTIWPTGSIAFARGKRRMLPRTLAIALPSPRTWPTSPTAKSAALHWKKRARGSQSDPRIPPLVSSLLNLKLAQMMVEMLIHQCGPFDRSEWAEKEVWMLRADRGAAGHKAIDRFAQVLLFDGEIAFIDHEQLFSVVALRRIGSPFTSNDFFANGPQQPSNEDARALEVSCPSPCRLPPNNAPASVRDSSCPTAARYPAATAPALTPLLPPWPLQRDFFMCKHPFRQSFATKYIWGPVGLREIVCAAWMEIGRLRSVRIRGRSRSVRPLEHRNHEHSHWLRAP